MVVEVEHFYGCYLLYSTNPKYKGRTYIGFTVNPVRRINQHNAGKHKGGAWRTSGRGPWDMTLIIHGFPSEIAALRFEWAWQNPQVSRRLKMLPGKRRKETPYEYKIRILSHMLCEKPWTRLPLMIRWLIPKYQIDLSPSAPGHMPIVYGLVKAVPKKKAEKDNWNINQNCNICHNNIKDVRILNCQAVSCDFNAHITCLAKEFLKQSNDTTNIFPVEGSCPSCSQLLLWGDLIFPNNHEDLTLDQDV